MKIALWTALIAVILSIGGYIVLRNNSQSAAAIPGTYGSFSAPGNIDCSKYGTISLTQMKAINNKYDGSNNIPTYEEQTVIYCYAEQKLKGGKI